MTTTPVPGQPAAGDTELRVLSDDKHLYALFVAHDPMSGHVRAGYGRRDTRQGDDGVALYVDPRGQGQRAYVFGCNALGVPFDGVRTAWSGDDLSWDARWECAASRTDDGFVVEIAVPWRSIRHPADVRRVGLIGWRFVARTGEESTFPTIDPQAPNTLAQQRVVDGPGALAPARGLDLVPELTFGISDQGLDSDRLTIGGFGPGLTARYAPGEAVQLLAAFNPDFSQVESDAARITVNRRYALDYPEKRPFFLEGQEWFDGPYGPLVYTRSMVTPLYGIRGNVETGSWSVSILHALDRHPAPTVSEGGGFDEHAIGAAAAVDTVARARCGFGSGSSVGLLLSDKELPAAGLGNRLGVADASIQLGERWAWTGAVAASQTTGVGGGVVAPAAATSLTYGTQGLEAFAEITAISPSFRAENGFLVFADRVDAAGGVYAHLFPRSGAVRQVEVIPVQGDVAFTTAGVPRGYEVEPEVVARLAHGWHVHGSVFVDGESFAGRWLDYQQPNIGGGGPIGRWVDVYARVYTGTGPYYDEADPRTGHLDAASVEAVVQVGPRLAVTLAGQAERMLDHPGLLPSGGQELYGGFAGRAQVVAFATPHLWARGIVDRDTFSDTTSVESLLAWEKSPGTAVYLGGAAGFADKGSEPVTWSAIAKVSWAFAL